MAVGTIRNGHGSPCRDRGDVHVVSCFACVICMAELSCSE